MLHTRLILLTFLGLLFSVQRAFPQSAVEYISVGDSLERRFDNEGALQAYLRAYAADSTNCTVLWKIAEAHVNLGEESRKPIQAQHYYIAEKWAKKALQLCPEEPNAHFFVAVTNGLLALFEGGKNKIRRSRIVKAEAEKTLELDPNHHGAYHVLGRWHRELANLNWFLKAAAKLIYGGIPTGASNEKAVAYFKKAIEIKPDWIVHHQELALTYAKMHRWREARRECEIALALPISDHQDPVYKAACRKLLKKIEKKLR